MNKSLERPILEYGHSVYQPHYKTVCSDLEDVQSRATKVLASIRDLSYPERLEVLKLPTLEHRRRRGDMIEVYKYLHGHYNVKCPGLDAAPDRGKDLRYAHSLKLTKKQYRLDVRGNYFSFRVVTSWDALPEHVVSAPSIDEFKSRLDTYWKDLPTLYCPTCQNF